MFFIVYLTSTYSISLQSLVYLSGKGLQPSENGPVTHLLRTMLSEWENRALFQDKVDINSLFLKTNTSPKRFLLQI